MNGREANMAPPAHVVWGEDTQPVQLSVDVRADIEEAEDPNKVPITKETRLAEDNSETYSGSPALGNTKNRKDKSGARHGHPRPVGGAGLGVPHGDPEAGRGEDGGKGLTYWADFLDLQCDGPVPWQKEILEGIDRCSKVVAFVDAAYLMSVNCLKELAYALDNGKPVVMLIVDESAWELLTVPRGAQRAWENNIWGPSLSAHAGDEFLPGEAVSVATVGKLYSRLAEINLCPCRPLEEANWTMSGLLRNMMEYVCKDIAYMKEHAVLKAAGMEWLAAGRPVSKLLHPEESAKWHAWLALARDAGIKPPPTALQTEFVKKSRSAARANRLRLSSAAGVLFLLILTGGIASVVLAVSATRAKESATASAHAASLWTVLGRLAVPSGSVYEQRALLAVLRSLPDLKNRQELYRPLVVETSRAFFATASLPSLGVGLIDGLRRSQSLAWSPDGSAVAAAAEEQPGFGVRVQRISASSTTNDAVLLTGPSASVTCLRWSGTNGSAKGASLAAGDAAGQLHVWNSDSWGLITTVFPFGAPAPVQHLAWHPDSSSHGAPVVAVAGAGGALALCRLESNAMSCERLVEAQRGAAPVFAVDWSPDGALLASAGADGVLRLWNHTAQVDAAVVGPQLHGLAFSPDGTFLAVSSSNEQRVSLFAIADSGATDSGGCALACAALPALLAASVGPGVDWVPPLSPEVDAVNPWLSPVQRAHAAVLGWNATNWAECAGCRRGDWSEGQSCDITTMYLGTCPASQLKEWDELSEPEVLAASSMGFTHASWAASSPLSCCHASGLRLAAAARNSTLMKQGSALSALGSLASGDVHSEPIGRVAFSLDGAHLASGWQRGVRMWGLSKPSSGTLVSAFALADANDVGWGPGSNTHLLAAALSPGDVPIVDTSYGGRHGLRQLHSQVGRTLDLAYYNGPGDRLITGSYGALHILDGLTGGLELGATTPFPGEWVNSLAVASSRIAIGVADPRNPSEGRVHLLDSNSLQPNATLEYEPRSPAVVGVAWSPDELVLAAAVGAGHDAEKPRGVVLWSLDASSNYDSPRLFTTQGPGSRVAFHPSRPLLAASTQGGGGSGDLHLWKLPDGDELPLPGVLLNGAPAGGMFGIAWHGDRLAAADSNGVVHILYGNLDNSGEMQVEQLQADKGITLSVDWSPDGKHLASCGTDGNVMIWNMEEAGKAYLQVKAEVGQRIFSVKWSPDGSKVVVGGDGGFVKVMPFITGVAEMDDALRSNLLPFTSTDFGTSDAIAIGLSAEATAGLRHDLAMTATP